MGMGADHGAHIVDDEVHDDPFRVAYCLAAFAGPRGYDLILTGVQSDDAMQGAVGPMVAACLGRPCATNVVATEWGQSEVIAVRELESGRRERVALTLPAVLTIQSGPDAPRYPSLSNLLRANRTELETHVAAAFNPPVARQCVARLAYPQPSRACVMLEGTVVDKARRLRALLVERNVL
jgi:electron transfer flavoprotein beta subunit